jgi:hypothetical protein
MPTVAYKRHRLHRLTQPLDEALMLMLQLGASGDGVILVIDRHTILAHPKLMAIQQPICLTLDRLRRLGDKKSLPKLLAIGIKHLGHRTQRRYRPIKRTRNKIIAIESFKLMGNLTPRT